MASRPRVLLVDTTVLYSAIVYRGLENKVLFSGDYVFVTTDFEVVKGRFKVWKTRELLKE